MAKTNAGRQRAYRANRPYAGEDQNGERKLNTWVSTGAALALNRLAACYGVTKRKMLEQLIKKEDDLKLKNLTEAQFDEYMSVNLVRKKHTAVLAGEKQGV